MKSKDVFKELLECDDIEYSINLVIVPKKKEKEKVGFKKRDEK